MDEDDEFYDTISVNSHLVRPPAAVGSNRNSINLSRNTIYHSTVDFDLMDFLEMDNVELGNTQRKNWNRDEIDFILAYEEDSNHEEYRVGFENSLIEDGLILKHEKIQKIHFTAIKAPLEVLQKYASVLKLRLPMKCLNEDTIDSFVKTNNKDCFQKLLNCAKVSLDKEKFPQEYRLTSEYSNDRQYLFDVDEIFSDSAVRITIVSYILERTKFGNRDQDTGIRKLTSDGVYKGAYPLHDGELHDGQSTRSLLYDEWASLSKWIRHQPLDKIKDYFGVKIALYFAWLGFYTHMLIIATVLGLFTLLYGYLTLSYDEVSQDICNLNITMCPLCDKYCDYWYLDETCFYSKITYTIDNPAVILFAVFMSIWSAIYLELWKRYSASITHRWGLTGFDVQAEPARPEYLTKLANVREEYQKTNYITGMKEPVVPYFRKKLPSLVFSFSIVLIWVFIACIVVFSIVIYRMSLVTSDELHSVDSTYRIYIVPITSGLLNLIGINVLNVIYDRLAVWLTDLEMQRTQTEYDDSLTVKTYMFKFVNFYSSIFYIAFFKGKFVGYPAKYNKIFGWRQEECNSGGCLIELTIQLAIIMVGNQALNAFMEMMFPILQKWWNKFKLTSGLEKEEGDIIISHNPWTKDFKLGDTSTNNLFSEYLEMVVQYGFVTIFVTAFPLAPLFALLNNIFEMRLDAKKFLRYYRRPVPERVRDIGVWMPIMNVVCRIAVISNAFIIAFSSHFIPKLVYAMKLSADGTETGFLEHSLAYFDTRDFPKDSAPINGRENVDFCRYAEYRNPPCGIEGVPCDTGEKYKRPLLYWHILAARLAFIVVYQNLVGFLISFVEWAIPDIPRKVSDRIKREAYQTNEAIIRHETERAKLKRAQKVASNFFTNRSKSEESEGTTSNTDVVNNDQNGGLNVRNVNELSVDQTAL